jgi:hypothetical protein
MEHFRPVQAMHGPVFCAGVTAKQRPNRPIRILTPARLRRREPLLSRTMFFAQNCERQ